MVLRDILKQGADTLRKAGVNEPDLDAWYLLSYCMGINRTEYFMRQDDRVDDAMICLFHEIIDKRAARIPLQYIIGTQEFMGLEFKVDENVLIPRQDTEILVELAVNYTKGKKVLDMCTGSGCIAVSISKIGKPLSVVASDISEGALRIAGMNAEYNEADIAFVKSDVWENIEGEFDIIVSNPPYITEEEMAGLMPEVKEFEPELALYGGRDGLDIYKRIMENVCTHLSKDGYIFLETGCGQGEQVSSLLIHNGFCDVKIEKDLAGLDRVVWGRRE